MFRLDTLLYPALFDWYKTTRHFFPLVGAVLLKRQDGVVYVDNPDKPRQAYVEHAFGFAQVFGETDAGFETELERYLLVDRQFAVTKVRLYGTYLPEFLDAQRFDKMRSFRQRFFATPETLVETETAEALRLDKVNNQNIVEIEEIFGVVKRFWRSPDDFIERANGIVVYYRGQLAGICYAAAEADHQVEMDFFVSPEFRRKGVGRLAITQFSNHCFSQSLQPVWDCFTNNVGSMSLRRVVGYFVVDGPYLFYTIDK